MATIDANGTALPAAPGTFAPAPSGGTPNYAFAHAPYEAEYGEAPRRHLRDYVRIFYKYRWLAAACFAIVFGASLLVTMLSPRLYTSATQLQVSRQSPIQLRLDGNVLDLEQNERNVNGASSFLATQVAMLESRDLAERVIRTRRLAENEAFLHPGAERAGLLAVGGQLLTMLRPRGVPGTPLVHDDGGAEADVDGELLDRYMRWLSVRDVRGTDLVEVRFTTPSPTLSAILAAAHTQAYLEANEEARLGTDATARHFLDQQLGESVQQLEHAQAALRAFSTEHPNVAVNQEQKVTGQKIGELSSLLTKAEGARVTLQSRFDFLTDPAAAPLAYFLDRPGIQKLHGTLLDLQATRTGLDSRLGPNHEAMVELRRQESIVARQLDAEVRQEVSGVRAKFDAAVARERGLREKLSGLETAAIELRDLGARYDLLRSDVESASALYASLLKQQMETAASSALAPTNLRVVERAEVPAEASSPRVAMNLVFGFGAGLLLACAATFLCEYFDDSVKSSEEMEGLLHLPALATIPNFALARRSPATRALGNAGADAVAPAAANVSPALVVVHEPLSPVAEAFRALRTAVLFSTPAAPPKMLLVTSAGASEGKTVSSLNLAATLAEAGSRVLLVDVDLRKPSCHRQLGITNTAGLSSFLAGQVELAAVVHALEAPRFDFIPAGPTPPNPAELVGSQRMRTMLEEMRGHYDFVVLDSPPVLPVTDAVVLAREVDGVVQVVKGHDTPRELIRRARDQLVQANAHLLGAVINNVDLGWGDLYFYNRYYGYYRAPQAVEAAA
ncbi:MAG: polysaccharide biosynthesis tyrosine autokinase [Deltaproteobacteria bacterium]|nr:polysaccharide biosynthesis tyrosine autokinase [Deltaproteobacteria bacterium]